MIFAFTSIFCLLRMLTISRMIPENPTKRRRSASKVEQVRELLETSRPPPSCHCYAFYALSCLQKKLSFIHG